jgi:GNAT superfamily N-acetyltransferase
MPSRRLWAFESGVLWALEMDGDAPAVTPPGIAVEWSEELPSAAASVASAMGHADDAEVRARFAAGSRCCTARVAGAIAAYGWISQEKERIGEIEGSLRLRADEAYIWDCATLPHYRRRGQYTALLGWMTRRLRGEGVRRVWIGASRQNRPSLRAFATAGFRPVIDLLYLRLGRWGHAWMIGHPSAPAALIADARQALARSSTRASGDERR